ncbi:sigma-70 family RNA polymerase sigma factor [uncultured Streptomyces sp.]|uniref:sigma-70 family RNA polymerase sigma factor n=1 Tax=uncultured Streptomyces sp. TaxID=174707 RepID=UPI00262EA3E6|nr:sigma-70 family RNA polymerase sigma factor [uncultured Streptomyces sp.]
MAGVGGADAQGPWLDGGRGGTDALSHREWSDPALTGAVREAADDVALAELYERHGSAVQAYARMCCRDVHTAEDLASEAFVRTIQAVRAGGGPENSWRPYLLTVVRRTAAEWAGTARRTELSADFERWLEELAGPAMSGEERLVRLEDRSMVLRGFRSLPERWQAALWYGVVEGEPAERIGRLLGISASGVASLTARAREGLRDAYLSEHAISGTRSEECRHYAGLLGAAVRRPGGRADRHLDRHLDDCDRCRRALVELTDLNERLRSVLPVAVLLWAGHSYVAASSTAAAAAVGAAGGAGPTGQAGVAAKLLAQAKASTAGAAVAAVAVTAALVGGLVMLPEGNGPGADGRRDAVAPSAVRSPTSPPASASPTGGGSPTPSASPSASASKAGRTAKPSAEAPRPVPEPVGGVTRLRLASTGLCMEIPQGRRTAGVRVEEAVCDGSAHQQWDPVPAASGGRLQLRNVSTGMCLGNTGTEQDGSPVTQAACDAGEPTQLWGLYAPRGTGEVRFIQEGDTMYLGLDEWNLAADGEPHSSVIGTTHHYYASPSFGFLYDGTPFDS